MIDYTGKTIYLGIDVHKATYSITCICDGVIVKRDKIEAVPEVLVNYCRRHFNGAHIKSAYEAGFSGFYLHRYLIDRGIENIVVHAASIEVSSRDKVKTDKRDSLKIASHLSKNSLRAIFVPSKEREDKRNLLRLREALVKQKTRVSCQIKSLLEYHGLLPHNKNARIGKRWLNGLLEMGNLTENLRFCITEYVQTWNSFHEQMKKIEKRIENEMVSEGVLKAIYCSVPGIGKTAANILINELGDTLHFSNEEKLFSHVGLTPREYSSGEHKRQGCISRQGKPILRRILVQAAWKAIKVDQSLWLPFEKIASRAKKKKAIVAIARILLGRIRSCIKRRTLYVLVTREKNMTSKESFQSTNVQ